MFVKSSVIVLIICGLLIFCTANTVSSDTEECPQICPDNYAPLCATNGKLYKKFSNYCELKANNCQSERVDLQKYVATDMDWCSTELVANLDLLLQKLDNVDLQTPDCMQACPLIYRPVCVSNGEHRITLSTKCIMEGVNCALAKKGSSEAFRVLTEGSC